LNLAARAGVRDSVRCPWVYYDTNVTGTLNLLEYCRSRGIPKFILASTSSLYSDPAAMPWHENAPSDQPLSPYAASKKAAETLAHTYYYLHGVSVTVVRYFTVYGPAGRPDMSVFRFVHAVANGRPITVYGDGEQERDFTFVDDIARGTLAALSLPGYEIINLGNDRPSSVNALIRHIERHLGRTASIRHRAAHPADARKTWADIRKAQRLLDWSPQVGLDEGVRRTIQWYQANVEFVNSLRVAADA
jgi:nucleoside-diphosphate-sugar epimerase